MLPTDLMVCYCVGYLIAETIKVDQIVTLIIVTLCLVRTGFGKVNVESNTHA